MLYDDTSNAVWFCKIEFLGEIYLVHGVQSVLNFHGNNGENCNTMIHAMQYDIKKFTFLEKIQAMIDGMCIL